ncbi:leucine-rich repeat protein [Fadolivirus algeromassiliense]|jgi:Ran GTPase-activating protein (RanGAP) involved in mRNA processing and transport|uniref:Leucine-rich repeat protein n=1 Tax=Fadolivirus FV1/VV64 TaxID=3070911 RepID=A0A7D3UW50_9VIRU|nr:leucine-rich repeat protein [Fadolivirus algeromassiliense]QKF94529.1 leucine-rich repeat protein [Fadolivirus FV1/VV64]
MLKYKTENKDNQWKILLNNITNDETLQLAVSKFHHQLTQDNQKFLNKQDVTDCAFNAPRISSSLDKKYNIAHLIAYQLYPIDLTKKDQTAQRKWSYIQYQRLLSTLSKAFSEQLEKEETLKSQFREVRKTHQRKYFCELKNKPMSCHITNPTPMPVQVSPIEELQPFFDHLSSNGEVTIPHMEFKRGVQYNDGRMDLCKQVVGPPHIGKLMASLKNNTNIEHFLLGNNIIGINGANAISEFLLNEHKPQIKTWYIAGNEIDEEGSKLIARALKNDTVCESLWLKRNPIKPLGAKYLGEMLEVNKTIKILDLDNTGILDEGTKYLMESLKKNTTLKHLYLDANGLTFTGAQYIAQYFDHMVATNQKGITSLWIGINRMDDEGAVVIANSLKNYKHLKRLCFNSNRLSEKGTKALCDALVDHENLILFDLGIYKSTSDLGELPNNMGDLGAEIIADFIKKNKSVKILSVLHNDISEHGIEVLANALKENDSIDWLYYEQYGTGISQPIRQTISNKLESNIKNHYNVSMGEYCSNILRYVKGSKKLKNIDSIYRNKM